MNYKIKIKSIKKNKKIQKNHKEAEVQVKKKNISKNKKKLLKYKKRKKTEMIILGRKISHGLGRDQNHNKKTIKKIQR